ncbi:MAG TPA: DUF3305 domain-containing protein [Noviherbaspirillum sp.]|nr:DUF3305 domain-containing protein [Noviherbaspirillum sp.]
METEAIKVAVIMQRVPLASRWQSHQWRPLEVSDAPLFPGVMVRRLRDDPADTRWLFSDFDIKLYSDEAEGYFLNIDAPAPCWFVMWRIEEVEGDEVAVPKRVTLSYNEAARLMDGGEQVDTVPASQEIIGYLTAFVQQYYRPEPKKKRRKPSFEGGVGVEQMAKAETDTHGR